MIAICFWLVLLVLWFTSGIGAHLALTFLLLWMVGNAIVEYILYLAKETK